MTIHSPRGMSFMTKFPAIGLLTLTCAGTLAAQQPPATRPLGTVVASSRQEFGPLLNVRHLRNGAVLVNDLANRRVVMLDSTLTQMTVVADSTPATANAYSGRTAGLIAYRGDSTLFVDPQSLTMLVIDPLGNVGRTMALPRSQDAMVLGNTLVGGAAYDGKGIVYRTMNFQGMMRGMRGAAGGAPHAPQMPDSTPIVRVDLATRTVDTLAQIRIPQLKMDMQRDENGRVSISTIANPLPVVDDWAVLADGSIALLRGSDYHVDFIRPDGTRESGAKIPFEWRRLSDEDKVAFMDSVKVQRERMMAQMSAQDSARSSTERGARTMSAAPGGGGGDRMTITMGAPGGGGGGGAMVMGPRNMQFIPPDELPDYQPVFFAGAARADADGNLWVRTTPTKAHPGGPVYDVVDAKGVLVDRVQVPADRQVVGFGAGGIVYLLSQTGTSRTIERARLR
jgi:hypothetical protein